VVNALRTSEGTTVEAACMAVGPESGQPPVPLRLIFGVWVGSGVDIPSVASFLGSLRQAKAEWCD
jgi:hypothetical protein